MIGPLLAAGTATLAMVLLNAALSGSRGGAPVPPVADQREIGPRAGLELFGRAIGPSGAVLAFGLGAMTGWAVGGPPAALGGGAFAVAVPIGLVRRRAALRASRINAQLIDAVGAVASAIRSGRSLTQSLRVAASEVGPPLGELLVESASMAELGVPLDEVLDQFGRTVGGPDARLVTGVLRLHRRTGGALATSLDDLTKTLRARRDGARELRSLTAQARLSAAILGLLPLGFFLFLSVVARSDVEAAYRSSAGASAIALGLALQGAAFIWIRRLLRVEGA